MTPVENDVGHVWSTAGSRVGAWRTVGERSDPRGGGVRPRIGSASGGHRAEDAHRTCVVGGLEGGYTLYERAVQCA